MPISSSDRFRRTIPAHIHRQPAPNVYNPQYSQTLPQTPKYNFGKRLPLKEFDESIPGSGEYQPNTKQIFTRSPKYSFASKYIPEDPVINNPEITKYNWDKRTLSKSVPRINFAKTRSHLPTYEEY